VTEQDLDLLADRLSDPLWRLTSGELYKIKTADGHGIVPFRPRPEQVGLLELLLSAVDGVKGGDPDAVSKLVKLKARRLGFSTAIGVFIADCLGFRKSFTATLIDQTGEDATKKMNGIVKVALNALREVWPFIRLVKDNDSELSVDVVEECDGSGVSTFFAGTKSRGGSNDFLWCSELGVIQFEDEARAEEIVTGAFPSARHGVIVVETTWKGGKGGKLWDVIKPTLDGIAADWRVDFTPWFVDPRNVSTTATHDAESIAYFHKIGGRLEREGVTLSDEQRRWWAAERRTLGIFMQRENPTFLDECWTAPIEGAVYAEAIERARTEGRICSMPVDGHAPVCTSWDLGAPKNTIVWYWQIVGREIRVIDVDLDFDGTIAQRAAMMKGKGYLFDKHYLPHDALQTSRSGTTLMSELSGLLPGCVSVPKPHSEWVPHNHLRELFTSLAFRLPACERGLEILGSFHTRKSGNNAGELVHDWSSHTADALATMAMAHRAELLRFKHTAAETRGEWFRDAGAKRKGMKPRFVSGLRV
jgi:hypothetical protein